MTNLTRRTVITTMGAMPFATSALAALTPYVLVKEGTSVEFTYELSGTLQSGSMPIQSAAIRIDTNRLQNSTVDVALNVKKARTRLPFARGPMLGPSVLDADRYPTIRFSSTNIRLGSHNRISEGATITGDLTIKGITKTVTLKADLYRKSGSAVTDLDTLSIRLTGALDRHMFGASGYPDLVGATVGLNIRAEIQRAA